jgi:hypothetical protein
VCNSGAAGKSAKLAPTMPIMGEAMIVPPVCCDNSLACPATDGFAAERHTSVAESRLALVSQFGEAGLDLGELGAEPLRPGPRPRPAPPR